MPPGHHGAWHWTGPICHLSISFRSRAQNSVNAVAYSTVPKIMPIYEDTKDSLDLVV